MSDHGHYTGPVNRPLTDEKFNTPDDGETFPYLGVCGDCGQPNSVHCVIVDNVSRRGCPR